MQIRRLTRNSLMFLDIPLVSILLLLVLGGLGVFGVTRWFVQDEVRCRRFKGPSKQTHCLWRKTAFGFSFSKRYLLGVKDVDVKKTPIVFKTFRGKIPLPRHFFPNKADDARLRKKMDSFFRYWTKRTVVRSQRGWQAWLSWAFVFLGFVSTLLFWGVVRWDLKTNTLRTMRLNLWVVRDDWQCKAAEIWDVEHVEGEGIVVLTAKGTKKPITPRWEDGPFVKESARELRDTLQGLEEASVQTST
jgi:hypothetical protein